MFRDWGIPVGRETIKQRYSVVEIQHVPDKMQKDITFEWCWKHGRKGNCSLLQYVAMLWVSWFYLHVLILCRKVSSLMWIWNVVFLSNFRINKFCFPTSCFWTCLLQRRWDWRCCTFFDYNTLLVSYLFYYNWITK